MISQEGIGQPDNDNDLRVQAVADDLWYPFKGNFESVLDAADAIYDMAIIAVRTIDALGRNDR